MRGTEMSQQLQRFQESAGRTGPRTTKERSGRALRLLCLLAVGTMLAGCGRCGEFWPWSQSQIGACHSDPQPQQ
jgi:hypothetical protein